MADDLVQLLEGGVLDTPMDENENLEAYDEYNPDEDDATFAAVAATAFKALPSGPSVNSKILARQAAMWPLSMSSQRETEDSGVSCEASPFSSVDAQEPCEIASALAAELNRLSIEVEVELGPAARRRAASESEEETTETATEADSSNTQQVWKKLNIKTEPSPSTTKVYDEVYDPSMREVYSREKMMEVREMVGDAKLFKADCVFLNEDFLDELHPTRNLPRQPREKKWQRPGDHLEKSRRNFEKWKEAQKKKKEPEMKDDRDREVLVQPNGSPPFLREDDDTWRCNEETSGSSGSAHNETYEQSNHEHPSTEPPPGFPPIPIPPGLEPPGYERNKPGQQQPQHQYEVLDNSSPQGQGGWREHESSGTVKAGYGFSMTINQSEHGRFVETRDSHEDEQSRSEYGDHHERRFSAMDRRLEEEERSRRDNSSGTSAAEQPELRNSDNSRRRSGEERLACRGRGVARYSHEDEDDDLVGYHDRQDSRESRGYSSNDRSMRGFGREDEYSAGRLAGRVTRDYEEERGQRNNFPSSFANTRYSDDDHRPRVDSYHSDDRSGPSGFGQRSNEARSDEMNESFLSADERHFDERTPAAVNTRQAQRPSGSQHSTGRSFTEAVADQPKRVETRDSRDLPGRVSPPFTGYEQHTHEEWWRVEVEEELRVLRARMHRDGEPIFPHLAKEYGTQLPTLPPLRKPSESTTWIEGKVDGRTIPTMSHLYDPETDTARAVMPLELQRMYREGELNSRTLFSLVLNNLTSFRTQDVLLNENTPTMTTEIIKERVKKGILDPSTMKKPVTVHTDFYGILDSRRRENDINIETHRYRERERDVEILIKQYEQAQKNFKAK